MRKLCGLIFMLLLGMVACQRREPYVAQIQDITIQGQAEITKLQQILAHADTAEDSLLLLTQAIANYADAGTDGHIDNSVWRHYNLGRKLHLCTSDSVKLLCGATSSLFLDAIEVLTTWQAFAYNHGAPIEGVTHVTALVNMNGKLIHADPLFGYVMYDAVADTLLDFYNELKCLKEGRHDMLKKKQLPFSNDFLICMDSIASAGLVNGIYNAIGLPSTKGPQLLHSPGICPYKIKAQMTMPRWLKLEHGGQPYLEWLAEQGHPSIEYLVLYPLGKWANTDSTSQAFADSAFQKIQVLSK